MYLERPHVLPSGHQRQQPLIRRREVRLSFRACEARLHDSGPEGVTGGINLTNYLDMTLPAHNTSLVSQLHAACGLLCV